MLLLALPRSVMSTTWRRILPASHTVPQYSDAAGTEPVANSLTGASISSSSFRSVSFRGGEAA